MKTVDFYETIAACDLKVGRCRQLIELMKIYILGRTGAVVSVAGYGPRGPGFETWSGRHSLWP